MLCRRAATTLQSIKVSPWPLQQPILRNHAKQPHGTISRTMTSQAEVKKIPAQVAAQYDKALKAEDAFYYPSEVHILPDSSTGTRVPWILRNVPALLQKPTPNAIKPEDGPKSKEDKQPQQNKDDVFARPYVPNLLVKECEEGVVLLNKFCVVPRHFLMVTKGGLRRDLSAVGRFQADLGSLLQISSPKTCHLPRHYLVWPGES